MPRVFIILHNGLPRLDQLNMSQVGGHYTEEKGTYTLICADYYSVSTL